MAGIALERLKTERKTWRRDHPHGFVARPQSNADGTANMMTWSCFIPGKEKTDWAGGYYPLTLEFSLEYPSKPPKVSFPRGFFHPNIYPSGKVCLSIIDEALDWKPSITVKEILVGCQELLNNANPKSPAQQEPFDLYVKNPPEYKRRVKRQVNMYPPPS